MVKNQEKTTVKKNPKLESTPVKFWYREEDKIDAVVDYSEGQNKGDTIIEKLKEITGVKDSELASNIIDVAVSTLEPLVKKHDLLNVVLQTLHDCGPRDAMEARLALQANVLFTYGMKNLKRSEKAEMLCHSEHYANSAIKLLRLHNETIEALNRYKRGGEQKIVVQHNVVADKAIVNFSEGGVNTKNQGENPCSRNYAEQKQEPMAINHVDNQQWPMGDVDSMGVNVRVPKQKKGA